MAGRPTKLTKKALQTIIELLEEAEYPVEDMCKRLNINKTTWYRWREDNEEFRNALSEAEEKRLEKIRISARKGLQILLEGKEWEETTTEGRWVKDKDGNDVFKTIKAKKVKKFILPNADMVKFALRNQDKENFNKGSEPFEDDHHKQPDKRATIKLPDGTTLDI